VHELSQLYDRRQRIQIIAIMLGDAGNFPLCSRSPPPPMGPPADLMHLLAKEPVCAACCPRPRLIWQPEAGRGLCQTVLDVGCGEGALARQFARLVPHVLGSIGSSPAGNGQA